MRSLPGCRSFLFPGASHRAGVRQVACGRAGSDPVRYGPLGRSGPRGFVLAGESPPPKYLGKLLRPTGCQDRPDPFSKATPKTPDHLSIGGIIRSARLAAPGPSFFVGPNRSIHCIRPFIAEERPSRRKPIPSVPLAHERSWFASGFARNDGNCILPVPTFEARPPPKSPMTSLPLPIRSTPPRERHARAGRAARRVKARWRRPWCWRCTLAFVCGRPKALLPLCTQPIRPSVAAFAGAATIGRSCPDLVRCRGSLFRQAVWDCPDPAHRDHSQSHRTRIADKLGEFIECTFSRKPAPPMESQAAQIDLGSFILPTGLRDRKRSTDLARSSRWRPFVCRSSFYGPRKAGLNDLPSPALSPCNLQVEIRSGGRLAACTFACFFRGRGPASRGCSNDPLLRAGFHESLTKPETMAMDPREKIRHELRRCSRLLSAADKFLREQERGHPRPPFFEEVPPK